jgi:energy-coupling factor transporter ATP-binding protein EcfA2
VSSALSVPARWFVDDVGAALAEVSSRAKGVDADTLRKDVAIEACNLVCGFIDADGRTTDDELWALAAAFGPMLDTQLAGATPDDVRKSGLLDGKRALLDAPTELFGLLVAADAKDGTVHSHVYYQAAVELAFAVAAVDAHTSSDELDVIERFRGTLLTAMDKAGVRRPGQPAPAPTPTPASEQTATTGPPVAPPAEPTPVEEPARPLVDLLAELDGLIGLAVVKQEVKRAADLTRIEQIRKEHNLPVLEHSRHLVFTGNPGTGKTTVARLLSQIYRTLGVIKKGHLVETDRSQLVAGFVGQTAIQVRKVFDEADGGMLLIDEAYALLRGGDNDFGREAIDTIVKLVEDRRDSIIVVLAGYPEEMAKLVDANPGLRSRFPKFIDFPDYTTDELMAIFTSLGTKQRYVCDPPALAKVRSWIDAQPRVRGFGNGRLVRNLFEAAVARQAGRLVGIDKPTDDQLCTLTVDDLPAVGEDP